MEKISKTQQMSNLINELSNDSKDLILREPIFAYKGQKIRLDFNSIKRETEQEVLEVQKHMAKIQSKKFITIKEYTDIYGASKTSQQGYRGRRNNPLPYRPLKYDTYFNKSYMWGNGL